MNRTLLLVAALAGLAVRAAEPERPTGELQEKAQALADLAVREGLQGSLQFCAFRDGKCIVDVWAGTMTTNPGAAKIDGTTLFPIFSTEKPILATGVHRTAELGKIDYDRPVSAYWPEFRGGGKEKLTVRELLGYRSGLPDGKPGTAIDAKSTEIQSDWKGMLEWYQSSTPELTPGTKQRYMPRSYGWAHGGLLEKVWKRAPNDVLTDLVLRPAGIANDFYFVCGDAEIPRIATVYRGAAFETMNSDLARRSFLPSAWAVASARGLATFYNRLCGFDGRPPLIRRETLDAALQPCRHASDPLPDAEGLKKWHMIFGMGYGLWGGADDISRVFGHGGVGGSEGLCDRSQRLAVGYTCNFAGAPPKLREAFYSLVGMRWRYWKDDVNIQDLQMATVRAPGNSVASFCRRAEEGDRLTVAFLGCSLTWGANATDPNRTSWRARIGSKLVAAYPKAHFTFVDAAIGGTDSQLAVFRVARDVVAYGPDLVFVDFSTNDGIYLANDNRSCSFEGILRHLLKDLPGCVPVPIVIPVRKTMTVDPLDKLLRRDEHLAVAKYYNLPTSDLLLGCRKLYAAGKADPDVMWPKLIGDVTHPHDYGYGLYADVVWDQVFAKPSDLVPRFVEKPMFAPKYEKLCRQKLFDLKMPEGWYRDFNCMRAGTFDFLCSRWQDGVANATTNALPFRLRFRGEELFVFGESTETSGNCEVIVDGKSRGTHNCSGFGRHFSPSAYLTWQVCDNLDPSAEHTLEIRPDFSKGGKAVRIESVCVAGREAASVYP